MTERKDKRFTLEPSEITFTEEEREWMKTLSFEKGNDDQSFIYTNVPNLSQAQMELIELMNPHQYVGFEKDNDGMIYAIVDGEKGV